MNSTFAMTCRWMSSLHEQEEVKVTSAMVQINLADGVVTRNQDDWAHTVQDDVRLSAYPLALWLAQSWWRLRYESLPIRDIPSLSWRMAHEMAAVGYGYVWPNIVFLSEGEQVHALSVQSASGDKEPVRYLSDLYAAIDGAAFEREIDGFIRSTIARLNAMGTADTPLHRIWHDVEAERADHESCLWRKLEAMLGYEPDDGPSEILDTLINLQKRIGPSAVSEIAHVCAVPDPKQELGQILAIDSNSGIKGHLNDSLRDIRFDQGEKPAAWERGWKLARNVRSVLGIANGKLLDESLCDILGIPLKSLSDDSREGFSTPIGAVIRNEKEHQESFILRKSSRNRCGRRFELTRFLCECVSANPEDAWLVSTDAKTTRQKIQRAFAAEFLCPIKDVVEYLGSDFSDDAIDDAAYHFMVSPLAVRTHLVNNHLLTQSSLNLDVDLHLWNHAYHSVL